jgi:hypothetical protein
MGVRSVVVANDLAELLVVVHVTTSGSFRA